MMVCMAQKLTMANQYACAEFTTSGLYWSPAAAATACEAELCAFTCADATDVDPILLTRCGC